MVGHCNKPRQQPHKDTNKVKPRVNQLQFKDSPTALIFYLFYQSKHSASLTLFLYVGHTTIKTLLWFSDK